MTIIDDKASDAAANMAQDVALWQRVEASPDRAFLRFYDWTEPCMSYGLNQKIPHETNSVRRPTGGGRVAHQPGDITYSLVIPLSFLPSTQLVASYRWLSEKVIRALEAVRVEAFLRQESLPEYQDKRHHDVCIDFPAKYEIVDASGRKLIGSAQRKGRFSLLQQTQVFGVIPQAFKEALAKQLQESFLKISINMLSSLPIIDEFEEKESQGKAMFHSIEQLFN